MKTKKGWLIIFAVLILVVALITVSFTACRQTMILRQQVDNIKYFYITQINEHEEDFEIMLDDIRHIEDLHSVIRSTETRRNLFPSYQESISIRVDIQWVIHIHYEDGQDDKIFIAYNGLFYRLLPTKSSEGAGTVSGRSIELSTLLMELFEERGFY